MTIKILATDANDPTAAADITEGVQILYDNVLGSMDWQSGFLDHEEQVRIIELGIACGFPDAQKHLEGIQAARLAEEKRQAEAVQRRARW